MDFEGDTRIFDGDKDTMAVVDMGCDEHIFPIVHKYVPDDFSTIQEAIDTCDNPWTIIVRAGTYVENIDFLEKPITLKSEQGPDVTIIDGNQAGSVVTCQSGEKSGSVLDGFTITNGNAINGGGMCNVESSPTVTNCIFTGNWASYGGGIYIESGCPTVANCILTNNSVDFEGGGMYNKSCSPTVIDCIFTENSAGDGGGMHNKSSNPTITNCTFGGNECFFLGGGIQNLDHSSPTVTNCTFTGNSCLAYGGGMYNEYYSSPTVTNCTFTGNSASAGGGMYNVSHINSTVTNCILWNDTPGEIYNDNSTPTVTYCCVQGGYSGTGNIDEDPCFLDPLNDDYHLTYASPCIDAGDNYAPYLPATDFEGDPRIFPSDGKGMCLLGSPPPVAFVDMGADEYCLMKKEKFVWK
jgi:hypothetical protein